MGKWEEVSDTFSNHIIYRVCVSDVHSLPLVQTLASRKAVDLSSALKGKKCHRRMPRKKERLEHRKSLCWLLRVFKALSLILLLFWTQIAVAQRAVAAFSHLGNAQQVHFLAGWQCLALDTLLFILTVLSSQD